MTERFNVSGALLVKLFGRPSEERGAFESKAGRVRDIGVTQAMYARFFIAALTLTAALATAVVYGWGGVQVIDGALQLGTVVALAAYLTRLYGPLTALSNVQIDVMTALVSFDRVFEVLDLPPDDRRQARMRGRSRRARPASSSTTSTSATRPPKRCPWPRWSRWPCSTRPSPSRSCSTSPSPPSPGSWWPWSGRRARARPPSATSSPASTTCTSGAIRINGVDVRDVDHGVPDRRPSAWSPRTPTCSTRPSGTTSCTPSPDATDGELDAALAGAQIATMVDTLPDGLDTVVGDRGYRLSGGEKQRLAIARHPAEGARGGGPRRGHRPSRLGVRGGGAAGPGHRPRGPHLAGHRPPAVHGAGGRHDPGARPRADRRAGPPRRAAGRRRGQYAELYRIQFERQERPEPA